MGREVVQRLLASGGGLVTVVVGAGAPRVSGGPASEASQSWGSRSQIDGGQPVYSVLVGVE